MLAAIEPVLRHLVASEEHAVFNDEIVARTRGMIESLAMRLLRDVEGTAAFHVDALAQTLAGYPDVLTHCHSLALESQAAERLALLGTDPVLPSLLQAQIAAEDPQVAALGVAVLAAQARFIQSQRRMEIAPAALPADVFALVLDALAGCEELPVDQAVAQWRSQFDEAHSRAALLARLAFGLGDQFTSALDPGQAGVGLFTTAVSLATGLDRADVVRALVPGLQPRLALMLSAAGLAPGAVEAVLTSVHPDLPVARHWLVPEREEAMDFLGMGDRL